MGLNSKQHSDQVPATQKWEENRVSYVTEMLMPAANYED